MTRQFPDGPECRTILALAFGQKELQGVKHVALPLGVNTHGPAATVVYLCQFLYVTNKDKL